MWGLLTIYWKQLTDFNAVELIGWRIVSASLVMAVVVSDARSLVGDPRRLRRPAPSPSGSRSPLCCSPATGRRTSTRSSTTASSRPPSATSWRRWGRCCSASPSSANGRRRPRRWRSCSPRAAVVELTISYGRPPIAALIMAVTWSFYGLLKRRVPLPAVDSFAAESFVLVVPAAIVVAVPGRASAGQRPAQRRRGRAGAGVVGRRRDGRAADPVRLRRRPRAVHRARAAAVPRADDQLPARLGAVRRGRCRGPRLVGFGLVWAALLIVTVDGVARHGRTAGHGRPHPRRVRGLASSRRVPAPDRRIDPMRRLTAAAAVVAALVLAACSPDAGDFSERRRSTSRAGSSPRMPDCCATATPSARSPTRPTRTRGTRARRRPRTARVADSRGDHGRVRPPRADPAGALDEAATGRRHRRPRPDHVLGDDDEPGGGDRRLRPRPPRTSAARSCQLADRR